MIPASQGYPLMVKTPITSTAPIASPSLLHKCRVALLAAGLPESEADEKVIELAAMVEAKLEAAPSPDMTVTQVGRYRNESDSTVQRKLRSGEYESYLSGRDKRLVTRESVEIDRGVCLLLGPRFDQGGKRGRPRKARVGPIQEDAEIVRLQAKLLAAAAPPPVPPPNKKAKRKTAKSGVAS
jgi:hypothetical protein